MGQAARPVPPSRGCTILIHAHDDAARAAKLGDDGTNDLLVSDLIRTAELQAWFLAEHLVDTPLVRVSAPAPAAN
jgi:starvation-inducible DNA-binding protein